MRRWWLWMRRLLTCWVCWRWWSQCRILWNTHICNEKKEEKKNGKNVVQTRKMNIQTVKQNEQTETPSKKTWNWSTTPISIYDSFFHSKTSYYYDCFCFSFKYTNITNATDIISAINICFAKVYFALASGAVFLCGT